MISNCTNTGSLSYEEPQKGDGVTEEEFQKAKAEYWKPRYGRNPGRLLLHKRFQREF